MKNGSSIGRKSVSTGTQVSNEKRNLRMREHEKDELAHYAKGCVDVEYKFPFGPAIGRNSKASQTEQISTCVSISAV
jgi:glycyl-tRNA synthetase (class II)